MSGPAPDDHSPIRAMVAAAVSIVLLLVLGNLTRMGGWSLVLVPLLAVWVITVYLGAPLNAPIQFERLRRLRR